MVTAVLILLAIIMLPFAAKAVALTWRLWTTAGAVFALLAAFAVLFVVRDDAVKAARAERTLVAETAQDFSSAKAACSNEAAQRYGNLKGGDWQPNGVGPKSVGFIMTGTASNGVAYRTGKWIPSHPVEVECVYYLADRTAVVRY